MKVDSEMKEKLKYFNNGIFISYKAVCYLTVYEICADSTSSVLDSFNLGHALGWR